MIDVRSVPWTKAIVFAVCCGVGAGLLVQQVTPFAVGVSFAGLLVASFDVDDGRAVTGFQAPDAVPMSLGMMFLAVRPDDSAYLASVATLALTTLLAARVARFRLDLGAFVREGLRLGRLGGRNTWFVLVCGGLAVLTGYEAWQGGGRPVDGWAQRIVDAATFVLVGAPIAGWTQERA